ncbi:MAG: hypothetical protein MUO64_19115 [Anaerolineales bacterium]|nr:hypothetical protein [Anaerolineales bacterium]
MRRQETHRFLACRAVDVHFVIELLEGRTLTSKPGFIRRVEGGPQVNLNLFQRNTKKMRKLSVLSDQSEHRADNDAFQRAGSQAGTVPLGRLICLEA